METLASGSTAPANAESTTGETTDADASVTSTEGGESASPAPEAGTPAPKKDPVQERFDKLTREKYDALRERDRNSYEIERLRAEVEQFKAPKAEIAPQDFPTLEQYGYDEGKFNAAVAAHFSKIATEQGKTAVQEQLKQEREAERQRKAGESWAAKEAEFIKSKPDYAEKVRDNRSLPITEHMAQVIQESEFGPQVAYHLGENPDKAAAIAALPPLTQAREIGRIEARFEAEKARPKPAVSQAPTPVPKIDAGDTNIPSDPTNPESDSLSDAEWFKRREKQIQKRRNR